MTENVALSERVGFAGGFHGVVATPAGPAPTVVLMHSWFGLTDHFVGLAVRLAGAGLGAVAVDLFDGERAEDAEHARRLRTALTPDHAVAGARSALEVARQVAGSRVVGALGFSMGGELAIQLAMSHPDQLAAVVAYYGLCAPIGLDRLQAPIQLHVATNDEFATAAEVGEFTERLVEAGRALELYNYPGTRHAFSNASRPESFHPEAAGLAWRRTVDFLRNHLGATG